MATVIYLNSLNLKYELKHAKNAVDMSPSGIDSSLFYCGGTLKKMSVFYLIFKGKGPMLKCGRYSIGEYEPIVNFCHLKV